MAYSAPSHSQLRSKHERELHELRSKWSASRPAAIWIGRPFSGFSPVARFLHFRRRSRTGSFLGSDRIHSGRTTGTHCGTHTRAFFFRDTPRHASASGSVCPSSERGTALITAGSCPSRSDASPRRACGLREIRRVIRPPMPFSRLSGAGEILRHPR